MSNRFWILSKENTAPFIVVALTYFLFLGSPFIYFLMLKGSPHTSKSVELITYSPPKDTLHVKTILPASDSIVDSEGYGEAQLNKFDDDDGGGTSEILTKNITRDQNDTNFYYF